jgi:RimJ/RimL family protein N-acetyltransferase
VGDTWLPADFVHPERVTVTDTHHLRPIRATDVDIDLPAVMGSRERLWSIYGEPWGWPPAHMDREMDQEDLAHHEREIEAHESFNYALLDEGETQLFGCVYIDAATREGADAEVSWWVVDEAVGTDLERALDDLVPTWLAARWPFERPVLLGRDVSWSEYLARPERDGGVSG